MVSFGNKSKKEHQTGHRQNQFNLVLHNDEVNTFQHVIDILCRVCNHLPDQAEQCALLTHFTGRCVIKKGDLDEMVTLQSELLDQELQVTIE